MQDNKVNLSENVSDIISAIRNSSDRELDAIEKVADAIDRLGDGFHTKNTRKTHEKHIQKPILKRNGQSVNANRVIRNTESTLNNTNNTHFNDNSVSSVSAPIIASELSSSAIDVQQNRQLIRTNEMEAVSEERKKRQWIESDSEAIKGEKKESNYINVTELENASQSLTSASKSVSDAMSEYADFYHDEKGKLRRPDGRFASKEENEGHNKASEAAAANREEKKQSLFAKLLDRVKGISENTQDLSDNEALDTAGAAGGSFYLAAKEIYELGSETVDKFSEMKAGKEEKEDGETKEEQTQLEGHKDELNQRKQTLELKKQTQANEEHTNAIIEAIEDNQPVVVSDKNKKGFLPTKADLLGFGGDDIDLDRDRDKDRRRSSSSRDNSKLESSKSKFISPVELATNGAAEEILERTQSNKTASPTNSPNSASTASKAGKLLGRLAAPAAGIFASYDKYQSIKDDKSLNDEQKAVQTASVGLGATGGALAGATLGASLGSFVPVIGNIIGGLLGGAVGAWLGAEGGDIVGQELSDHVAYKEIEENTRIAEKTGTIESQKIDNSEVKTIKADLIELKAANDQITSVNQHHKYDSVESIGALKLASNDYQSNVISLDKASLDAIRGASNSNQSNSVANNQSTNVTNVKAVTGGVNNSIPSDFEDNSLRRLSMDLE